MKYCYFLLFFFLLTSCCYFDVKKTSSESILEEELQSFDWNDVDQYPSFTKCDSLASKGEKKNCFQNALTFHISSFLQQENIIVTQDISDTIILTFQVSETGVLKLLKFKIDSSTVDNIPDIKNIIFTSLDSLPKIFPATKRGQQVKTEFTLPIIISVK